MEDWKPPVGVYVGSEDVGRMVVQMCRKRRLRVPQDVAIIAGWNEKSICEQPQPSLTSAELGGERIGNEAARLLHRMMDGEAPPTEPILLPPQGLVVRESTDFFAVDDELVASALLSLRPTVIGVLVRTTCPRRWPPRPGLFNSVSASS